jgi:hypothetical protein
LVALLGACEDTTPQWQLEHDRIIAVRATPPHAAAGGRIDLDVLVTAIGEGPQVVAPLGVQLAPGAPPGFEESVIRDETGWAVIVPDEATLEAARVAMGLEEGAPVPLTVGLGVHAGETDLAAVKMVFLGDDRANPELGEVTVAGEPASDDMTVPVGEEVELTIDAAETDKIDWLTSVGDLTDIDDLVGHLEATEAAEGFLAVVQRDEFGGVVWGYWTVTAQ